LDLQLVPVDKFQVFLICAARIAGLIGGIPVFSSKQAPAKLRAALVIILALVLFPILEQYIPSQPLSGIGLIILVINEALVGFLVGLIARLIFTAVELGGTVIGYQMGFAAANVLDPQNQHQISLMSQFQNVFAILIFLALNVHHIFLQVIVYSYRLLPPGHLDFSGGAIPFLMQLTSNMFVLGVKFSAPVLAVLLLSGLVLGIMARIFPQLNVFMLSFPLNIGLSFLVIGLTLGMVASLLSREFDSLGEHFLQLFQLLNSS
jgi:flagellar biosynthetic protein FliR